VDYRRADAIGGRAARSKGTIFLAPSQGRSVCANQIFASLAPSTTRCEVLTYRFTHPTHTAKQGPRVAGSSKCQYDFSSFCTICGVQSHSASVLGYTSYNFVTSFGLSSHFNRRKTIYTANSKLLPQFSSSCLRRTGNSLPAPILQNIFPALS
jgi:hypothetical protein